jgi:hypothetical protein
MQIEERIPLLEDILSRWEEDIGKDYLAYKNHVYRVVHFTMALHRSSEEDRKKIIIAGCFHDLGIWADQTVDYLPPSMLLAKDYLRKRNLENWIVEIELMIDMHHKLSQYKNNDYPLVEVFRKADLVDVSLGIVKWNLSKDYIRKIKQTFPNSGFHKRLNQLAVNWILKHPLNPLPFVKW